MPVKNGGLNKMKKRPEDQSVTVAGNEDDTKTLAEYLSEMRRNMDWVMGVYGIPLEDLTDQQQRARKDNQLDALAMFVGAAR